jgi:ankyrin repeat protein
MAAHDVQAIRTALRGKYSREDGVSALHMAIWDSDREVVKTLLDAGIQANELPLQTRDPVIAELLLAHGGAPVATIDGAKAHAIHWAASQGALEVVKLLVERGADVNDVGPNGRTPLHRAAESGVMEMVAYLLKSGANAKTRDMNGNTAVYWATMATLKKHTAFKPPTRVGAGGAGAAGEPPRPQDPAPILKLLLAHGTDVNAHNDAGYTALHQAAVDGKIDSVRLLLSKGADVTVRTKKGRTAEDLAKSHDHPDVAEMLRAKA